MTFGFGYDMGFGMFRVLFILTFLLIISLFVIAIVKGLIQNQKDNNSPRLTVSALIVTKRIHVTRHRGGPHNQRIRHTSYYVTFQVESGDRMELKMTGTEYGMLAEGDRGYLTFQGSRYLGFERI